MKDLSTYDLTTKLKKLSKKHSSLKASMPSNPSTPEHFVTRANIQNEMAEIGDQQTEIGKELLHRDEQAKERKLEKLNELAANGEKDAKELLEKLPAFANALQEAFTILGREYTALEELSKNVRSTNLAMLNANRPAICRHPSQIEPNNLQRLVKHAFLAGFGSDTANVFLSHPKKDFDLNAAVAKITELCIADD